MGGLDGGNGKASVLFPRTLRCHWGVVGRKLRSKGGGWREGWQESEREIERGRGEGTEGERHEVLGAEEGPTFCEGLKLEPPQGHPTI